MQILSILGLSHDNRQYCFFIYLLFLCSSVRLCLSGSVGMWVSLQSISSFEKLVVMRLPVTSETKNDKNGVINIRWVRLSSWKWPKIGHSASKKQIQDNCWIGQHVYVIFDSWLELKKIQTAVSKHLGILPSFSTWYVVMLCDGSVKCDGF